MRLFRKVGKKMSKHSTTQSWPMSLKTHACSHLFKGTAVTRQTLYNTLQKFSQYHHVAAYDSLCLHLFKYCLVIHQHTMIESCVITKVSQFDVQYKMSPCDMSQEHWACQLSADSLYIVIITSNLNRSKTLMFEKKLNVRFDIDG